MEISRGCHAPPENFEIKKLGNTIFSFLGIKISKGNDKIFMSKMNMIFYIYKTFTSFKGNERVIKIKWNEKALTSAINILQKAKIPQYL